MLNLISATTAIGDDVKSAAGEDLGNIEELMIDVVTGRVTYAVLSFGGMLGIGDKYFAVPWEALILDTEEECFRLNVNKELLEEAEGFDKDDWPDMADSAWAAEIYTFYGYEPFWETV